MLGIFKDSYIACKIPDNNNYSLFSFSYSIYADSAPSL